MGGCSDACLPWWRHALSYALPDVVFGHVSVLVPEQALRVPQVAGIVGCLGSSVAKVKGPASGLAGLVEAPAKVEHARRPAVVVLDQKSALALSRPGADPLDQMRKLADYFNRALRPGLVLCREQRPVADVGAFDLQHVGGSLAGQQGDVHFIPQRLDSVRPHRLKLDVRHGAVAA